MGTAKVPPWAGLRGERTGAPEDPTHSRIIPAGGVAGSRRSRDAPERQLERLTGYPWGMVTRPLQLQSTLVAGH